MTQKQGTRVFFLNGIPLLVSWRDEGDTCRKTILVLTLHLLHTTVGVSCLFTVTSISLLIPGPLTFRLY